jgi:hypothetical protein
LRSAQVTAMQRLLSGIIFPLIAVGQVSLPAWLIFKALTFLES